MPRGRLVFVLMLLLGAFLIRLGVVLASRDLGQGPIGDASNDDVQFHRLALSLADGEGYRIAPDRPPTSFRAPGFPFYLAGLYLLVGDCPTAAYLSFCVLGALACLLTYFLAREVLTETGARIAGVLAALYLPHAWFAANFISENLFVPCLALGLWLAARAWRTNSAALMTLAGLALGFTTLTRPAAQLLLLLPVAFVVAELRAGRIRLAGPLLYVLAFVAMVLPWSWRNYQVHGRAVLVATNGGTTFRGGNNDRVLHETRHLGYWLPSGELPRRDLIDAATDEVTRDQIEWQLGKQWLRDHWSSAPLLGLLKLARLWWLPEYGAGRRWLRVVTYAPYFVLLALAVLRCAWRRRFWAAPWPVVHAATLMTLATAVIFCGEPRYRDAIMPVLMIYAAIGLRPAFASEPAPDGRADAAALRATAPALV